MYRRRAALLSLTAAFSLPVAREPCRRIPRQLLRIQRGRRPRGRRDRSDPVGGQGHCAAQARPRDQTLWFQLTYSGLSSPVVQSHIHLGKNHVAGNVMVFFCSNNNVPNVQPCPADGGTVTGTITAANVLAIATQNVTAGDFDALTDALSSNTAYANIHTMKFPAGEIRGQIHRAEDEHHGHDHDHDHDHD